MSSSSRHVDSSVYTPIPDEFDTQVRMACFYLYTRPLNDAVLGESDDMQLHHWALVAVFLDESFRTMEGAESGGLLCPFYSKEGPKESKDCRPGTYYELVPIITSPDKLRHVTVNNILNGTKYSAILNNCQSWVKACAETISPRLAHSLDNYKTNGELPLSDFAGKCSWASSKSSSQSVRKSLIASSKRICSSMQFIDHHKIN